VKTCRAKEELKRIVRQRMERVSFDLTVFFLRTTMMVVMVVESRFSSNGLISLFFYLTFYLLILQ